MIWRFIAGLKPDDIKRLLAVLLRNEIATELRGRYEDMLMLPFSFMKYLRSRGYLLYIRFTSPYG